MRFHLVGLPHTQSTAEYSNCAFNSLLRGFAKMMKSLDHEVFVYSSEDNDAECDEHHTCISKKEQHDIFRIDGPGDILTPPLDSILYQGVQPWWQLWNDRVWQKMRGRIRQGDFVGIIGGGVLFEPLISNVLGTGAMAVEYAIGYSGVSPRTFHAYGASSWWHVMFGLEKPKDWRGSFYHRVIPHYFDPDDFTYRSEKDDYFLYLGKLKEDKGVGVAAEACRRAGVRFIAAGDGPTPVSYGDVRRHYIGPDERRELLAGARGLFVPSLYVEPFGMVAVEGLLSGTPIITTPFGGVADINIDKETGFECYTMADFVDATQRVSGINPGRCREEGMKYSYERVRHTYQRWFDDLTGLWGEGWSA